MSKNKSALLLLPNLLGEHKHHEIFLPQSVAKAMTTIDGLIAESESGGRRFLKCFQTKKKPHEMPIALFNKHTKREDIEEEKAFPTFKSRLAFGWEEATSIIRKI